MSELIEKLKIIIKKQNISDDTIKKWCANANSISELDKEKIKALCFYYKNINLKTKENIYVAN